MSREIDERVVQMQFQNDKFENNVGKTINSLGKLQDALKFKNADAGLNDIQEASNKLSFGGISKALSSISEKFESMGTIGTRILQNLTDRAFGLASRLTGVVKSMTIDQIGAGFTKYAEKTQSVQTIMAATSESWKASADAAERANFLMEQGLDTTAANKIAKVYGQVASGALKVEDAAKQAGIELSEFNNITGNLGGIQYAGKQMEYVDAQLSKLNWFTDETSYAFLDMVSNIGKFTSNNIGLNESVTAMQGIATWAGISGANVNEAGRAMYNLSQALATGSVKLIDWRSIENANMATSAFKETVIETAVELGELQKTSDGVIKTIGKNAEEVTAATFNSTLAKGWFTADVLMKTLDTYGSFTDELYKATEQVDLEASEILGYMDEYRDGTIDMTEASKDAGVTAEELSEVLEHLTDSTFALGEKAFRASQEAKTFEEAIEATKDAVSSGWMETFELIFGNYEQAKVLWTNVAEDLYSLFVESGNARNELLESWSEMGGSEDFTAGIHQTLVNLIDIKDWFTEKFNEFLPSEEIIEFLYNLTKGFREFNDNLHENTKFWDIISYLAEAFGNVLEFVVRSVDRAYKVFSILISPLKLLEPLFTAIARFIMYVAQGLNESSKNGSFFEERLDRLNRLMAPFNEAFGKFIYNLSMFIRKTGKSIQESEGLQKIFSFLRDTVFNFIAHLINFGTRIFEFFNKIHDGTAKIPDPLKKIVKFFKDIFQNAKPLDIVGNIFEKIGNAVTALKTKIGELKIGEKIGNIFHSMGSKTLDVFSKLKTTVTSFFQNLKDGASIGDAISNSISTAFNVDLDKSKLIGSLEALIGGGLLAGLGKKFYDFMKTPSTLTGKLQEILDSVGGIIDAIKEKLGGEKESLFSEIADNLKKLAIGIAIIAGSLFVLSLVKPERLASATTTLVGAIGSLMVMLKAMSDRMDANQVKEVSSLTTSMIKMSIAIVFLSKAMKNIGSMDMESLLKAVIVIPLMLKVFDSFSKKADPKMLQKAAKSLNLMAKSLKKLAIPLFMFNFIKWDSLLKATGMLLLMGRVMKKLNTDVDPNGLEKVSKAFAIFGLALLAMAPGLFIMNFVSWWSLLKAAAAIVGFYKVMDKYGNSEASNNMFKMAGVLAVFGLALLLCVPALIAFSLVPFMGILKVAASLFVLFEFLKFSGEKIKVDNLLKVVGAIALIGLALGLLVIPLMMFAAIKWESLGKAAAVLVGVFVILGLAGLILSPLAPVILTLAGALALLGAGLLMIAAAVATFNLATFFGKLAKVTEQVHEAVKGLARRLKSGTILAAFKNLLQMFVEWVKVIPQLAIVLAEGLLNFIATLGNGASKIILAAVKIGMAILTGLEMLIPKIIKVGIKILLALLQGIYQTLDQIIPLVFAILFKIIEALNTFLPTLIDVLFKLVISVINGVANAIRENSDAIWAAVGNLLSSIIELVLAMVQRLVGMIPGVGKKWSEAVGEARNKVREFLAPESLEADGEKASGGLLDGLTKGLSGAESVGEGASGGLLAGLFSGLSGEGEAAGADVGSDFFAGLGATDAQGEGEGFSMDFVQGMLDAKDDAKDAGETDAEAGVKGAGSQISNFFNVGGDSAKGFANGMTSSSALQSIANAGAKMGQTAKNALKVEINSKSPSKEFAKIGGYSADGYVNGTENKFNKVEKTYKAMGRLALDSAIGMANEIEGILNDTSNQPVITPVVDMDMVREAAGEIGKTFGRTSIGVQNARAISGLTSRKGYSTQYTGDNVVEAIDGLRVDVSRLEKVMGNMQVRMDTGALVGSMVGPMDNALGARMLRRRRG